MEADKKFKASHSPLVSKRILVTEEDVNGKTLSQLSLSGKFGVNVTRIYRTGVELLARPDQRLQVGDRIKVVGPSDAVDRLAARLGNSHDHLDHPNILTIFIGIFIGILFGSLPITISGMPTPVKLGLAGGPLIISILISRFGYRMKLVTYTTVSANLMLREIGLQHRRRRRRTSLRPPRIPDYSHSYHLHWTYSQIQVQDKLLHADGHDSGNIETHPHWLMPTKLPKTTRPHSDIQLSILSRCSSGSLLHRC